MITTKGAYNARTLFIIVQLGDRLRCVSNSTRWYRDGGNGWEEFIYPYPVVVC
ncbi:hypothetical protein [Nostoc sp. 2RC]|uniref:hypothetical protein n=1 Tax=Nostoc sp. 2RC TaxID=2485484 RepID=UPI001C897912|nr:hypothetical protein [Nostoc sp. 2RC]